MRIYAHDLHTDHKIVTQHLSYDGDLFEREVLIDFIRYDDDGDFVVVEGYYDDNGDEFERLFGADEELTVR